MPDTRRREDAPEPAEQVERLHIRRGAAAVDLTTQVLYTLFFVCEDLTTLLVMMQNAAVAQELFTATAARRVVGLVPLSA